MNERVTMLVAMVAAAALGIPSVSPRASSEPPITIFLKGGTGLIRADRVWEDGHALCWESRGFHYCMPHDKIDSARGAERRVPAEWQPPRESGSPER